MLETLLDNLFILNGVFRPNNGSIALAKVAINYEGSFLDLGTGSGFITIAMYQSGKIGDSSDISSLTLSCAEKNFNLYNIPIKPIQSNLFEEITSTYDTIIFNPPTNNFLMEGDENILKNKLKNIISLLFVCNLVISINGLILLGEGKVFLILFLMLKIM